jgi:hypothetical protein
MCVLSAATFQAMYASARLKMQACVARNVSIQEQSLLFLHAPL